MSVISRKQKQSNFLYWGREDKRCKRTINFCGLFAKKFNKNMSKREKTLLNISNMCESLSLSRRRCESKYSFEDKHWLGDSYLTKVNNTYIKFYKIQGIIIKDGVKRKKILLNKYLLKNIDMFMQMYLSLMGKLNE